MALEIGTQDATSGMTRAIYDQIRAIMEPDLGELSVDDLNAMRESWKKLSFAVANGVIEHILSNMEIRGVQTQGDVTTSVNGTTGPAPPAAHAHSVGLSGNANAVTFTQSNDGTGLVQ